MEGHAKKCVERYCELANKTTQQLYKVSTACIDDHHFEEEELKTVGELSKVSQMTSLQCQCLSWLMIERGNLLKPMPTKFQKLIKKRPRLNGGTCVTILRFRNGCKNSGRIWWRNSIQGGSHASSPHEVSLEPTFKRREDSGKHNVYTAFP